MSNTEEKLTNEKSVNVNIIDAKPMFGVTEDLDVDMDLYNDYTSSMMTMQPGMKENMAQIIAEMKKIKGVRVLETTSMSVMGTNMNTKTELIEFKEATAPAGTFDVPAGYTPEKMND